MKSIITGLLLIALAGCATDVSEEFPHQKLVNIVWELNTDAYLIEYFDNRGIFYIAPCDESHYVRFPNWDWKYDESNIGNKGQTTRIVAGLRKGTKFRILRVIKDPNPVAGTSYFPFAILLNEIEEIGEHELNAHLLYRHFYHKGILNPEYATKLEQ